MTAEGYAKSSNPTLNHFPEKLLTLKTRMRTGAGKAMAAARHDYMLRFLEKIEDEVAGLE